MEFGQWRGLFEWSMKHQDGTKPTDYDTASFSTERKQWLEDALKQYMQDFAVRMRDIKAALDETSTAPATLEEKEAMLEELMDITCSIDHARDLHKIGGLHTLLELLGSQHPSLRWRAAEVVATCVQNNPPVQEWFLEGGALPRLMQLGGDPDPTCRSKALLALSGMVRHYEAGLGAFRGAGGLQLLLGLLRAEDPRLQRKALSTLEYVLSQAPQDCEAACRQGALPALTAALGSEEPPVREAALQLLLQLVANSGCTSHLLQEAALPPALQHLQQQHLQLPQEEQEAWAEELQLSQRLDASLQLAAAQASAPASSKPESGSQGGGGRAEGSRGDGGNKALTAEGKAEAEQAAEQQKQRDQAMGLVAVG